MSSRLKFKVDDDIYRFYVTNSLMVLTGNTAKFAGGKEMTARFSDIVRPPASEGAGEDDEQQKQEAEDIITNMKSKLSKLGG